MTHSITVDWVSKQIATITFADRARHNQISWAAIDHLGQTLTQCREEGARVVILASGLEGHWFEHASLEDLSNGVNGLEQTGTGAGWFTLLEELAHQDLISIAAVSGDCSGGGAEIGWACDLRIAEVQARFAQPEVNIGLTTGIGGCSRLARLAGRTLTTEMVLTGRPVAAQRLWDLGAINRVVASGEALNASIELALELAQKSSVATGGLKRILAISDEATLPNALVSEQEIFQSVLITESALEGMASVQKKYDEGVTIAELNNYESWREK